MKISFINCVANMCEAADADIVEVAAGMGTDKRIGRNFLSAGLGYGGSCFPKDVKAFRAVGSQMGLDLGISKTSSASTRISKRVFCRKSAPHFGRFAVSDSEFLGLPLRAAQMTFANPQPFG